ncbi:Hypothetical predicted protein, partial [Olea europaea subsp. europaea]
MQVKEKSKAQRTKGDGVREYLLREKSTMKTTLQLSKWIFLSIKSKRAKEKGKFREMMRKH